MKKYPWLCTTVLLLLAGLTSLAFSIQIPIPLMEDLPGATAAQQMLRILRPLFNSFPDNHVQMLLTGGAAFWLYRRFLLNGSKRGWGEYVLSGVFALCMLFFSSITCIRYALPIYYAVPMLVAVVCHERIDTQNQ